MEIVNFLIYFVLALFLFIFSFFKIVFLRRRCDVQCALEKEKPADPVNFITPVNMPDWVHMQKSQK